jgi:hypothetical protein
VTEVAATSALPGRAEAMLGDRFELRVHRGAALTGEDDLAAFIGAAAGAVTLLANPVSRTVLERCPQLKVVGNVAVGYDNVDVAAAAERGVWVTNTPDVLTDATADLAWALVLAVTRRLGEAEEYLRSGRFRGWALDLLLGTGLQASGSASSATAGSGGRWRGAPPPPAWRWRAATAARSGRLTRRRCSCRSTSCWPRARWCRCTRRSTPPPTTCSTSAGCG